MFGESHEGCPASYQEPLVKADFLALNDSIEIIDLTAEGGGVPPGRPVHLFATPTAVGRYAMPDGVENKTPLPCLHTPLLPFQLIGPTNTLLQQRYTPLACVSSANTRGRRCELACASSANTRGRRCDWVSFNTREHPTLTLTPSNAKPLNRKQKP